MIKTLHDDELNKYRDQKQQPILKRRKKLGSMSPKTKYEFRFLSRICQICEDICDTKTKKRKSKNKTKKNENTSKPRTNEIQIKLSVVTIAKTATKQGQQYYF